MSSVVPCVGTVVVLNAATEGLLTRLMRLLMLPPVVKKTRYLRAEEEELPGQSASTLTAVHRRSSGGYWQSCCGETNEQLTPSNRRAMTLMISCTSTRTRSKPFMRQLKVTNRPQPLHHHHSSQSAPADGSLSVLSPCSEEEVRRLIMQSTKSSALDTIPTYLLKEMVDVLLPYLTAMVNTSLREGRLPSSHKHAVITPLLKKTRLDPDELKNYRPVSNLTKLAERVVSSRLVSHLNAHGLMPQLQSAYRRHHRTETALLKVLAPASALAVVGHF